MTTEELKIRQLANQHLLAPTDKLTVLHDLCGVQAQFMANAIHSLKIRSDNCQADTFKDGLVKNWTVRGTVHVFAEDDLPLFMHCTDGNSGNHLGPASLLDTIVGHRDIETEFDTFVETLYDMGLQKMIDIKQAAYERAIERVAEFTA